MKILSRSGLPDKQHLNATALQDLRESEEEEAAMENLDLLALLVQRVTRGIKATKDHGDCLVSLRWLLCTAIRS